MTLWAWLRARWRRDAIIDSLIKPPVSCGFGKHDQSRAIASAQRRARADILRQESAQIAAGPERARRIHLVEKLR